MSKPYYKASEIEASYYDFILSKYPERYHGEEGMIRNWEEGFAFDQFADWIGLTEQQLLEAIS